MRNRCPSCNHVLTAKERGGRKCPICKEPLPKVVTATRAEGSSGSATGEAEASSTPATDAKPSKVPIIIGAAIGGLIGGILMTGPLKGMGYLVEFGALSVIMLVCMYGAKFIGDAVRGS